MMGLETLIAVNSDIARQAARRRLKPYVPSGAAEVDRWKHPPFEIPNLGFHEPKGWEKTESWFADKFGVGSESEPAMTHRRLREVLRSYVEENPDHGFAITEEGQFQCVVSAFKPVEKN